MNKTGKWILMLIFVILLSGCKSEEAAVPEEIPVPQSEYVNVMVGNTLNNWEPQEASIVINPANTSHLLIGTNQDNYYYSRDAGFTWTHGRLVSSYTVYNDPCVLVDQKGNYYYFHLTSEIDRVVCQKTSGLGNVWSNGSFTGLNGSKDQDKEWAVIDRENNRIYLSWSEFDQHGSINPQYHTIIKLSFSADGGISWSDPKRVSNGSGDATGGVGSVHAPMPAVGPNGEVYVAWMSPTGIKLNISMDQGKTWLNNDIAVTANQINWLYSIPGLQRAPGFPVIVCDLSDTSTRGNLYLNWSDKSNGSNDADIWMVKSADSGQTWSLPVRVNDDQPGKHQFFSWMAIDQVSGYLYFVFYDRRNYTDLRTDVYMAVSRDGGLTFENFIISDSPFTPVSSTFLGDYIGITAHNGIVRPVWPRIDSGNLSLWTALVDNL